MARASYVAPVKGEVKRLDQGIDYQGTPGDPVVSIGLARVDYVKDDPGGFGKVVYYTLLDGPARGQQIYVGHAAPTVHSGQIVQAGQPVATLQQVSGGNATNLPGWTEVGFAKGGVPEGPQTAKSFQKLVGEAGSSPAADSSASSSGQVAGQDTNQAQAPALPTPGQDQPSDTQADVYSTQPYALPPGSGMVNQYAADLWNRIASQPGASADTQLLAQNATLGG